jgi:TonB family protein
VLEKHLVTVDLGPERRALLVDVSMGGAAVQPYTALHTGQASAVRFAVPGEPVLVEAEGVVTWVSPSGRAGIQFTNLGEEAHGSLKAWMGRLGVPASAAAPHAAYASSAYLPPSYSPWIKIGQLVDHTGPLQEDISSLDLVSALRLVVERARSVTRAQGAVIALADGGDMVCRARTGVAPDLGARFRPDTGLSGEAVRTGAVALCRDSEQDPRVDPAACQRLNVRSIAIVPILSGKAVIGVVEAFSAECDAFGKEDVANLRALAELTSAMLENSNRMVSGPFAAQDVTGRFNTAEDRTAKGETEQVPGTQAHTSTAEIPADGNPGSTDTNTQPSSGSAECDSRHLPELDGEQSRPDTTRPFVSEPKQPAEIKEIHDRMMNEAAEEDRRQRRKIMLSVVAAIALGVGGFGTYQRIAYHAPRQIPQQMAPQLPALAPQNTALDLSESATAPVVSSTSVVSSAPVKRAAARTESEMIAENWVWTAPDKIGQKPEMKQESVEPVPEPPVMPVTAENPKLVSDLFPAPSAPPELVPPPVQAPPRLQEGRLVTRISPAIPAVATASGLHGAVLVKLAIGKTGRVEKAELVSGNAILGHAAVEALRRWRYQPFKLNGQPVSVEKLVTINFADPRK